jgi:V8-like Glu-specific endopeptidase
LAILIPKAEENICKIYCTNGSHGTGFFCNIQYDFNFTMKVLMTNHHVLNEEDILKGKKIVFSTNNDKIFHEVLIDESRKIYTDKDYDITIIELKKSDKLVGISFFEIDNRIFKKNFLQLLKNEQIYLLHYPKGKEMEYSMGLIKYINEDDYTINHSCDSSGGSSGGPIINTISFQVLGIHKGEPKEKKTIISVLCLKGH